MLILFVPLFVPIYKPMAAATESVYLDWHKIGKDARVLIKKGKDGSGTLFPVRLRITFQRISKYYTLQYVAIPEYEARRDKMPEALRFAPGQDIYLTYDNYSKITTERPREPYSTFAMIFTDYCKRARNVIDRMPKFSFEAFEKKMFSEIINDADVISVLKQREKELREEGRISYARGYGSTTASLKEFTGEESLSFHKITVQFLNKYEKWMLSEQKISEDVTLSANSPTTVGMYLRNLRTVYRKAIKQGIVSAEEYPFSKDDYQIPTGSNIKKALTQAEVAKIAAFAVDPNGPQHRYRDYWLFSYLCNGINIKDMARLKYSNIDGETLSFKRAKTEREKKSNPKTIQVVITKAVGRIIDKWGNKPGLPTAYIFPILTPGMTPQEEYNAVFMAVKQINKYIKQVAEDSTVKITQHVTSYVARHSFSTVLKRSGASTEFISESLGHASLTTTENYLAQFEVEEKKKWAEKLLPENN